MAPYRHGKQTPGEYACKEQQYRVLQTRHIPAVREPSLLVMQFTQDSAMKSRDIENRYIQDRTAPSASIGHAVASRHEATSNTATQTRRRSHPAIAPATQKAPKGPAK